MNRSENINELAAALAKAQGAIGAALKTASNPFFKSKYADLGSVIEAVKQPLSENGIAFWQAVRSTEGGVAVETVFAHASGQWISETLELPVAKDDAQGIGSAITYGKRYGLQALAGVPSEDDDGNAAASARGIGKISNITPRAGAKDNISPEQRQKVDTVVRQCKEWINKGSAADAVMIVDMAELDTDEKVYFWDQFDSKERSAMKKEHEAQKKKMMEREAAGQI